MTGYAEKEKSLQAIKLGAQGYIIKGEYDENILEKSIFHSIERHKINHKLGTLNKRLDQKVVERTALLEDALSELRNEIVKKISRARVKGCSKEDRRMLSERN